MKPHTQADRDAQELIDARAVLEEAGERWIELHARKADTKSVEAEVAAAEKAVQHLETKLNRR